MRGGVLAAVVGGFMATGCVTSTPGLVRTTSENPLVSIGAGQVDVGGGGAWLAWYVIDRRTETCWLKLGDSAGALDCCALRKVPEAAQMVPWTSDAECSTDEDATTAPPAAPASTP